MHAENGRLRLVEDGRAKQGAKHPAVGDGEGAAAHLLQGERAVAGFTRQLLQLVFDVGKAQRFDVADRRHDQAVGRGDGKRDIHIVVIDQVFPVNMRVDVGHFEQNAGTGLCKQRHEPEFDAIAGREALLIALPQGHDGRHVHLVERGQHSRFVLGADQAAGDGTAHTAHFPALFVPAESSRGYFLDHRSSRSGRGWSSRRC